MQKPFSIYPRRLFYFLLEAKVAIRILFLFELIDASLGWDVGIHHIQFLAEAKIFFFVAFIFIKILFHKNRPRVRSENVLSAKRTKSQFSGIQKLDDLEKHWNVQKIFFSEIISSQRKMPHNYFTNHSYIKFDVSGLVGAEINCFYA